MRPYKIGEDDRSMPANTFSENATADSKQAHEHHSRMPDQESGSGEESLEHKRRRHHAVDSVSVHERAEEEGNHPREYEGD